MANRPSKEELSAYNKACYSNDYVSKQIKKALEDKYPHIFKK